MKYPPWWRFENSKKMWPWFSYAFYFGLKPLKPSPCPICVSSSNIRSVISFYRDSVMKSDYHQSLNTYDKNLLDTRAYKMENAEKNWIKNRLKSAVSTLKLLPRLVSQCCAGVSFSLKCFCLSEFTENYYRRSDIFRRTNTRGNRVHGN